MLFAGCGLGDNLLSLALQLKHHSNVEITAIDLSPSSLEILRKRLKLYKIDNVEVHEMSLLDLTPEVFGKFDFINCIGVLHHLEDPSLGLKALNSVLADDGVMEIMVYAQHGRTGVYQMQELLRRANADVDELDYKTKLERYKRIYPLLQPGNWFKKSEGLIGDHLTMGDNGVIDLLLHHQDRAYTVPELYDWVEDAGLNITCFNIESRSKLETKIEGIEFKTKRELHTFNELFYGDIIKHHFFLTKSDNTVATLDDLNNTLLLNYVTQEEWDKLIKQLEELGNHFPCPELNFACPYYLFNNTHKLEKTSLQMNVKFKSDFVTTRILKLIDGKTKTKRLFSKVREQLGVDISNDEMLERFRPVYEAFNLYDALLLAKQNKPQFQ